MYTIKINDDIRLALIEALDMLGDKSEIQKKALVDLKNLPDDEANSPGNIWTLHDEETFVVQNGFSSFNVTL